MRAGAAGERIQAFYLTRPLIDYIYTKKVDMVNFVLPLTSSFSSVPPLSLGSFVTSGFSHIHHYSSSPYYTTGNLLLLSLK